MTSAHLPLGWFNRHPVEVAFDLVGCWFEVEREDAIVRARIVETEAYAGTEDAASHASLYRAGPAILAMPPGSLYMQRSYGLHTMTNIVAHRNWELGAVLIRSADDPEVGLDLVIARRGRTHDLLTGPGNFSQGIGTRLDDFGQLLDEASPIRVLSATEPVSILAGPRIGISKAIDAPWRFWDAKSRHVSKTRRGIIVNRTDLAVTSQQLESKTLET